MARSPIYPVLDEAHARAVRILARGRYLAASFVNLKEEMVTAANALYRISETTCDVLGVPLNEEPAELRRRRSEFARDALIAEECIKEAIRAVGRCRAHLAGARDDAERIVTDELAAKRTTR